MAGRHCGGKGADKGGKQGSQSPPAVTLTKTAAPPPGLSPLGSPLLLTEAALFRLGAGKCDIGFPFP